MKFDFSTSSRILFATDGIKEIGKVAIEFGKKGLFICSRSVKNTDLLGQLKNNDLEISTLFTSGEPTIESVNEGIRFVRAEPFDFIVAMGGGSTIDTAKAISAMATNPGDLLDYIEVIGRNQPIQKLALPLIAIPTTAGTGSEVTRNAVLRVQQSHVKVSLRSMKILPRVALIDPGITLGLSPEITASTGMDALTQLIEPYLSKKANYMTDMFCTEGIARIARSLEAAYKTGENINAREDMCWGSLLSGLALANAGLGAVHGFAGVIGGMFLAPHGEICARLLPEVMERNYRAILQMDPGSDLLGKFTVISRLLTGHKESHIGDGIDWIREKCKTFSIPQLREHGITESDFDRIVENAKVSSSMKSNPVELPNDVLLEILQASL